jgi:hypothetical protein
LSSATASARSSRQQLLVAVGLTRVDDVLLVERFFEQGLRLAGQAERDGDLRAFFELQRLTHGADPISFGCRVLSMRC